MPRSGRPFPPLAGPGRGCYGRGMATYLGGRIETLRGDITQLAVDAIVNAANSTLLGGGGVDGAIHRAAGPALREECAKLGGARTGEAKMTRGHALRARHVIHAVGPVWSGGAASEDELLASCYRMAMQLVRAHGIESVAFPAISTGAFGFPLERATRIAVAEVQRALAASPGVKRAVFCCFSAGDLEVYDRVAAELAGPAGGAP